MKISIIIPAYNEADYIARCIQSLLVQDEKPDEIIVVDNNSTDSTITVAKSLKVTVLQEKRQGIIYARKRGFNAAKYDIIVSCDADTLYPKNWIKKIKKQFKSQPTLEVVTGPVSFKAFSSILVSTKWIMMVTKMLYGHQVVIGANYALRKTLWNKIKNEICLDNKKLQEDLDISIHIQKYSKILFQEDLVALTSLRRLKFNPFSLLFTYPKKTIATYLHHRNK